MSLKWITRLFFCFFYFLDFNELVNVNKIYFNIYIVNVYLINGLYLFISKALEITLTEEKAMAPAAILGDSSD